VQASALLVRPPDHRARTFGSGPDDGSTAGHDGSPPRTARSSVRLAEAGPPAPLHVLVVDDEHAIRALCRVNLELGGFEVTLASTGPEALETLGRQTPDVILLDVMMPELDGWEVAERIRAADLTRDVPIVFLSARAARADRQHGFDVGAVAYVVKPFDPIHLAERLDQMLERLARGERDQLRQEMLQQA
jgi:CheY-like chemotaxis protein